MSQEFVEYNGARMIKGWPERIQQAQLQTHYSLLDGRDVARVRYGDETDYWGATNHACGDCRVIKGQFHVPGCDVERCAICGDQAICCDCPYDDGAGDSGGGV